MSVRFLLLLLVVAAVLAGCNQYSLATGSEFEAVEDSSVVRSLQYLDDRDAGPEYEITVTLPEDWVGRFETRTRGNSIVFRYLADEDDAESGTAIFYIDALSNAQYWEQVGGYPGQYTNIVNTADTYFVYHLPIDAYYSGLDEDDFEALAAAVPEIAQSLQVVRKN